MGSVFFGHLGRTFLVLPDFFFLFVFHVLQRLPCLLYPRVISRFTFPLGFCAKVFMLLPLMPFGASFVRSAAHLVPTFLGRQFHLADMHGFLFFFLGLLFREIFFLFFLTFSPLFFFPFSLFFCEYWLCARLVSAGLRRRDQCLLFPLPARFFPFRCLTK